MLVNAHDIARACVASVSIRRHHPEWLQWLFIHDTLPAPWADFASGVFDTRMATPQLPPLTSNARLQGSRKIAAAHSRSAALLGSAFAHLFNEGADSAIYVDANHVWMAPLQSLQEAQNAHDVVVSDVSRREHHDESEISSSDQDQCQFNAHSWFAPRPPLIAVRRTAAESLPSVLADIFQPHEIARSGMHVLDDESLGVDLESARNGPLRFATGGNLQLGERMVTTVNFYGGADFGFEAEATLSALGTPWLELTKWYANQLRRFGGDSAVSARQLRHN